MYKAVLRILFGCLLSIFIMNLINPYFQLKNLSLSEKSIFIFFGALGFGSIYILKLFSFNIKSSPKLKVKFTPAEKAIKIVLILVSTVYLFCFIFSQYEGLAWLNYIHFGVIFLLLVVSLFFKNKS